MVLVKPNAEAGGGFVGVVLPPKLKAGGVGAGLDEDENAEELGALKAAKPPLLGAKPNDAGFFASSLASASRDTVFSSLSFLKPKPLGAGLWAPEELAGTWDGAEGAKEKGLLFFGSSAAPLPADSGLGANEKAGVLPV